MEVECTYRERVPFASFTMVPKRQVPEESFVELEQQVELTTSDVDLRSLAKALSKIKLMHDIETNPGPNTFICGLQHMLKLSVRVTRTYTPNT